MTAALWRLVWVQAIMNASHFMAMPIIGLYCLHDLGHSEFDVSVTLTIYFLFARVAGILGLFATPAIVKQCGRRLAMTLYIVSGAAVFMLVPLTEGPEAILFIIAVYSVAEVGALTLSELVIAERASGDNAANYFALFFVSWGIGGAIGSAIGPHLIGGHGSSWVWFALALLCSLTVWGVSYSLREPAQP